MNSSEQRMRNLHSESVSQVEVTNHFAYCISNNLLSIVISITSRESCIRISLRCLIYRLVEGIRAIGVKNKLSQLIVCSRVQVLDLVSHFVTEDKLGTFCDRRVKSDKDCTMNVAISILGLLNPAVAQLVGVLPLNVGTHHLSQSLESLASFLPNDVVNDLHIIHLILLYISITLGSCLLYAIILSRERKVCLRYLLTKHLILFLYLLVNKLLELSRSISIIEHCTLCLLIIHISRVFNVTTNIKLLMQLPELVKVLHVIREINYLIDRLTPIRNQRTDTESILTHNKQVSIVIPLRCRVYLQALFLCPFCKFYDIFIDRFAFLVNSRES